jgi:DNA-binding PucR family transcriptional regulator
MEDGRGGGAVLRETLRAYLGAECNVSCAAKTINAARSTAIKRLRTIEARLGLTLNPCPAELEVALALDELGVRADTKNNSTQGGGLTHFEVTRHHFPLQSV